MLNVMLVIYFGSGLMQLVSPLKELGERFEYIMGFCLLIYTVIYLLSLIPAIF